jgi:hypothetical protein
METDPRLALERLLGALERHFEASAAGRGEEDPAYEAAYRQLIEAFEAYDDALYDTYGIDTPFLVYEEDDDDDDDFGVAADGDFGSGEDGEDDGDDGDGVIGDETL